jgi:hypothetical protein
VATTALSPGDTVVGATGACTAGFEKRSSMAAGSNQYRFMPNNIEGLRSYGYTEIDGSAQKTVPIRERMSLELRLDVLNIPNTSFLGGPNTTPTSSQFGQVTSQNQSPNRFPQIKANLRW